MLGCIFGFHPRHEYTSITKIQRLDPAICVHRPSHGAEGVGVYHQQNEPPGGPGGTRGIPRTVSAADTGRASELQNTEDAGLTSWFLKTSLEGVVSIGLLGADCIPAGLPDYLGFLGAGFARSISSFLCHYFGHGNEIPTPQIFATQTGCESVR